MRKFIYRICHVIGNFLIKKIADKIYSPPSNFLTEKEKNINKWLLKNGDKTLRLIYELNENSIVFDLGGYQGQWASDIYSKYNCNIFIFEPCIEFSDNIRDRFLKNTKIKVFPFGLAQKTHDANLTLDGFSSSIYSLGEKTQKIHLKEASDFINQNGIAKIDLMKINIEGGEYDLLEHLIESGLIKKIKNIQIQFHDFVTDAEIRMEMIQEKLNKTHHLTYQYVFVWENWEIN